MNYYNYLSQSPTPHLKTTGLVPVEPIRTGAVVRISHPLHPFSTVHSLRPKTRTNINRVENIASSICECKLERIGIPSLYHNFCIA